MRFTVVDRRDDHELEDAVRRGVADGLARLLGVPQHPASVQAMLDENARGQSEAVKPPAQADAPRLETLDEAWAIAQLYCEFAGQDLCRREHFKVAVGT